MNQFIAGLVSGVGLSRAADRHAGLVTPMTARDGNTVTQKGGAVRWGERGLDDGNDGMTAFPNLKRVRACARVGSCFALFVLCALYIKKCRHAVIDKITERTTRDLREISCDTLAVMVRHCRHAGVDGVLTVSIRERFAAYGNEVSA